MSNLLKYSIGFDISKDSFQCCFSTIDKQQVVKVKSTKIFRSNQFDDVKNWIDKHYKLDLPLTITMEATGVYYEQIAWFLFNEGYRVSVILPNKAKKYLESLGLKSKTDKIDAKGLARMGAEQNLDTWQPVSTKLYELRTLTRNHQYLQETKTKTKNRLHSVKYGRIVINNVVQQLEQSIQLIESQLEATQAAIASVIDSDPVLKKHVEQITAIKGLALITVATIIAETDGFALIKNQSQLVSYAGYDVVEDQSGKRVGKTKISKKGNSRIRRVLHMASLTAVSCNQKPFSSLYERVYEKTKIKMKGYVAVQRKLLVIIYALWKKNEKFDENYKMDTSGNHETMPLFQLDTESGKINSLAEKKQAAQLLNCLHKMNFRLNSRLKPSFS